AGDRDPAAARVSGDRGLRARDRGDRAPHHPHRDAAARGGIRLLSTAPKGPVPLWRWAIWWVALGLGMTIFYVVLTPIWLGLRLAGRLADLRARARPSTRMAKTAEGEQ